MNKKDSFYKTEELLKNYTRIKKSIDFLTQKLENLKKEQSKLKKVLVKSDKVVLKEEEKNYYYTDETLENDINELMQLIIKTKAEVEFVDSCLKEIEDDEYYDVIRLWYFEKNYTREKIAEIFDCDLKTITRNKTRLINKLKYLIFSRDSVYELIQKDKILN